MKKSTFIFLFAFVLASFSFELYSAETLLLKYDFNGGLSTPSYIADGVVSAGLNRKGTLAGLTTEFATKDSKECLVLKTTQTAISATDYIYIPIEATAGKKVQISKTVLTHRKAIGNTTTGNLRGYLYTTLSATSSTQNLIYQGTGGYTLATNTSWLVDHTFLAKNNTTVAPIDLVATEYAALGFVKTTGTDPAEWWIDEIAYYGSVFTEGEVIIATSVDFGDNNVVSTPKVINLSIGGYNVANDVTITIEGTDAAMFSVNNNSFTAAQVNAGTTVDVTYTPGTVNAHSAYLKLTYGEKEDIVSLTGSVALVNETFDTGDMTALVDNSPLSDLAGFTVLPGWTMENVVKWHKSGLYAFTPALLSSVGVVAKYSTPELDLSKPYKISLIGKKNSTYGQSYIFAGQDTICYYDFPTNVFESKTIDGFVAAENTKLTFSAVGIDLNYVLYDNILISISSSPALSLPLRASKNFGSVLPNATSTLTIPLKAFNLTSDLTVSLPATSDFELMSSTTISKAAAEAGTEISVKFKPTDTLNYADMIQVSGGGLPSGSTVRTIYLLGAGDVGTHVIDTKLKCKLIVEDNVLNATVDGVANLEIYSFNGMQLQLKNFVNTTQTVLSQGAYLVRLSAEKGVSVQKIIVK